ncbi:MAG: hypothetical protein IPN17_32095 [Deltaproteobacteria bacterium]|nr:hypothetical protein [Deltaproteobacteria bacterium]
MFVKTPKALASEGVLALHRPGHSGDLALAIEVKMALLLAAKGLRKTSAISIFPGALSRIVLDPSPTLLLPLQR